MSNRNLVRREAAALAAETKTRVKLMAGATALLWGVELVDQVVFGGALDGFGIKPRSAAGLVGILFAPFLHAGFGHLIANTVPFAVLGFLTSSRRLMDFVVVTISAVLVGGLGTWLFGGPSSVHIGASGVIFGYLGFLMGRGIFDRRPGPIALSVIVSLAFGGMLWGLLPLFPGISWQGHLFGFIGGLLPARVLGKAIKQRR